MENIVIDLYVKFHYDWLQNEKDLGNWKSDNNKSQNTNNICSHWEPVLRSNNENYNVLASIQNYYTTNKWHNYVKFKYSGNDTQALWDQSTEKKINMELLNDMASCECM